MSPRLIGLTLLLAICTLSIIFHSGRNYASVPLTVQPIVDENQKVLSATRKFTILPWTSFWRWDDFGMGEGNRGFQDHQCDFTNCYLTLDKSKLYSADVILLHGPAIDSTKNLRVIHQKRLAMGLHGPLYVFFDKEPPMMNQPEIFDNLINITMTYRRDSNVLNSFGRLYPDSDEAQIAASNGKWLDYDLDDEINALEGRTLDVAWIVSNCHTESKREEMVKVLREKISEHLQIDIYGKCGRSRSMRLPQSTSNTVEETLQSRQDVYVHTLSKYKFYLSLENSLCRDYVSEKLFLAMFAGTIPIVYGGLSKSDYLSIVPPNSFIYAEDFPSIQALGQYLVDLSKNETAYNSYFWWRRHYKLSTIVDENWNSNCDLCKRINQYYSKRDPDDISRWNKLYQDFKNYWQPSDICRQPGNFSDLI